MSSTSESSLIVAAPGTSTGGRDLPSTGNFGGVGLAGHVDLALIATARSTQKRSSSAGFIRVRTIPRLSGSGNPTADGARSCPLTSRRPAPVLAPPPFPHSRLPSPVSHLP